MLTNSLNDVTDFLDADKRKDGVEFIAKYFRSEFRRGSYFCKFILCECLNFINVLGQIYFTDRFLGYQFTTYGLDVLNKSEENFTERDDAMNRVFPKVILTISIKICQVS